MKTQKTLNSQSNLEKEKRGWRNQAPRLQTILQSYSNENSILLTQKQKYRSMEQGRNLEINSYIYGYLNFDKGGKIYNGGKTASSISHAGKTGQLHVKE